jgi:hypothetical protein
MTETVPEFTPEAISAALIAADFVPYDPTDDSPEGFAVGVPNLMGSIVVRLRGVDLLEESGPGSWPRKIINRYAEALKHAGYSARVVVDDVIVTAPPETP